MKERLGWNKALAAQHTFIFIVPSNPDDKKHREMLAVVTKIDNQEKWRWEIYKSKFHRFGGKQSSIRPRSIEYKGIERSGKQARKKVEEILNEYIKNSSYFQSRNLAYFSVYGNIFVELDNYR